VKRQDSVKTILIISNLYSPVELGSCEILAGQVCEDLVGRGYRVVVLTSVGEERVHRGVEILPRLQLTRSFDHPDNRRASRRWWVHRQNQRATAAAIAELQPDATLCFSMRRLTLGPAAAIEQAALPRLFVVNDAWPLSYRPRPHSQRIRSKVGGWIDRNLLSSLTTLATSVSPALLLSQSLKDELLEGGLPMSNTKVVHQGVPTELFCPAQDKSHSFSMR
jgi:hypothetical protein